MDGQHRESIVVSRRVAVWMVVAAIVVGFVAGRALAGGGVRAASPESDATATRSAELEELDRLRTQVAQTVVCTSPTPTETPIPTATATVTPTPTPVPPAAMGEPVTYAGDWTVVVRALTAAPTTSYQPQGKFVVVAVTITNNATEARTFPFEDWVLTDAQGRPFQRVIAATTELNGPEWYFGINPGLPIDLGIVFDVAVDAGPAFILESKTDPTFRVAVQLQLLG